MSDKKNDEIKKNEEKEVENPALQACQKELETYKDKFVRVAADFKNFKGRVEKEKASWIHIAQSELMHDLLSIVDDFDRALQEKKEQAVSEEVAAFLDGFVMIRKSLYKFLENYKVAEITEIKQFDPNLHEAIAQVDSDKHESGDIVEVLQKGFMFKDLVLRPAKVVVAK